MARRYTSTGLLTWKVLAGAVVTASLLLMLTLLPLLATRSRSPVAPGAATVVVTLIAAETSTPTPGPTAAALTPGAAPLVPTPVPGVISIGAYVQIVGTQDEGLRMRTEPGLGSQVLMLGSESEVFRVEEGPQEVDGYTWWYLVGPFDSARSGWAVVNYLQLVENQ